MPPKHATTQPTNPSPAEFFGWKRHPFADDAGDAGLLFTTREMEILAHATNLLKIGKSFALIGAPGTGKTTLLDRLVGSLDARSFRIVRLPYAGLNRGGLVRTLADMINVDLGKRNLPAVVKIHRQLVAAQQESGSPFPVFVFDDAQHLEHESLTDICSLMAHPDRNRPSAAVILSGDDTLERRLRLTTFRAVSTRMACFFHLEPLQPEDAAQLITTRLEAVKASPNMIDSEAIDLITAQSRGNKRDLLNLATALCVEAHHRREKIITSNLLLTSTFARIPG